VAAPLYAEDLIVPVVRAPSEIKNLQWDSNGNDFMYQVGETVFKRDAFSLILKETWEGKNDDSESPAPELPEGVKTYSGVPTVIRTKAKGFIVADSGRTVSLYNKDGKKLKTYTNANIIAGFSLSPDEETLVVFDLKNTLNFYNIKSGSYLGNSPKFGIKKINVVLLNKDSSKILVSSLDNTVYVTRTQDILFSPETTPQQIKQFPVQYNIVDPNNKENGGITEYTVREVQSKEPGEDTEFIISTKEKANEKQSFDLTEEKKKKESEVVIVKQPEQEYFPPSETEQDKEVIFSNKETIQESRITEYKLPEKTPIIVTPITEPENIVLPVEPVVPPVQEVEVPREEEKKVPEIKKEPRVETQKTVVIPKTITTVSEQPIEPQSKTEPVPQVVIVDNNKTEQIEKPIQETTTITETYIITQEEILDSEEPEKKEEEIEEPEEVEEEEIEKEEKPKKKINKEDMKTYFKDGHGLLFNIGGGNMQDPYILSFSFATAYLNYDLIYPFHFGGYTSFSLGIPKNDYPYKYANSDGTIHTPYLADIFIAAPIGFSIYPFKNSLEIFLEVQPGAALYKLWNGVLGSNSIAGKFFPVYRTSVKIGAAWDFINISASANYDTVTSFTYEIYIGALVNIGGSRTIGSTVFRK